HEFYRDKGAIDYTVMVYCPGRPLSYPPIRNASSAPTSMLSLQEQLLDAAELLREARRIVVLTGAGMSTESGIPDFRSPGSVWLQHPPVSYSEFLRNPEARQRYWQTRHSLARQVASAQPNAAHRALVELERRQILLGA